MPDPLAARDLRLLRPVLTPLRRLVDTWFRADVEGLDRVPDGPVLFVGNHSGGAGSPDSVVFILAFLDHFGVDRPLFWLAHDLLMKVPGVNLALERAGVVAASPDAAREVLDAGGSVIVYPGGEVELHRPWWERNQIKFLGRTGFLRLAREAGVPIVPVVAHGAHNTYLPLTDGRTIAERLRLDRLANLKTFPVALSLPWGLDVGGLIPHFPLPVRIRVRVLDPVDVEARFGDDLDAAYDHVTTHMQQVLSSLADA